MDGEMRYDEYYSALRKKATGLDMDIMTKNLRYKEKSYKLLKLTYEDENDRLFLITSGIHGDEIAGPLTILDRLEDIVGKAKEKNVGLIVYPCINPSGFDIRNRYNISDNGRQIQNNDFIRYVVEHKLRDDLYNRRAWEGWFHASDEMFSKKFPAETNYMHEEMKKMPWKKILAHLDIHQHVILEGERIQHACTYAYTFEEPERYKSIISRAEKIVPILKNTLIDKGYIKTRPDEEGYLHKEEIDDDSNKVYTDEYGTVYRHDGSITALANLEGVKDAIAIETTSAVPLEKAIDVNMLWYEGLMDIVR